MEWLLWLLPALYLVEVILGGPVSVTRPLRFALFGGAFLSLLVAAVLVARVKQQFVWPIVVVWAFLLFNLLWSSVVPMLQGSNMEYAAQEVRAYLVLALVILFLIAARGRLSVFRRLQQVVVAAAVVLALVQFVLWLVGTLMPELQVSIVLTLRLLFGDAVYVGPMPDGFFRVFWISSLWFLLALFWTGAAITRPGLFWIAQAILLMGVFVTYSRGLWLGLVIAGVTMHAMRLMRRGSGRLLLRQAAATLVLATVAVLGLNAVGELDRGIDRFTSSAQTRADESVSERVRQTGYLYEILAEHPIVGAGYGAYSNAYIRDARAPYSYENVPYALLAKLGIVGTAIFAGFFLLLGVSALRASRVTREGWPEHFCGSLIAFLIAAMTNPMLINFVGISILACLLVHWAYLVAGSRSVPEAFPRAHFASAARVDG
jgi:O-antigen ligase